MPNEDKIILVNENDEEVGTAEKLAAHRLANLHRAFSVFIFNSAGEMLLQKRARAKYHSGGLWSNACCSHPMPGESIEAAGHRRLKEEMGFDADLTEIFSFIYKAKLNDQLTEHEYDHVLVGKYDGKPAINPLEVEDYKWLDVPSLQKDVNKQPEKYTYWLNLSLNDVLGRLKRSSLV